MSFNTYWSKSLAQWIWVLGNVEIQDVHETTKAVKPKLLNQSFPTAIRKLKLSTCELVRRLWLEAWRGDIAGALLTPTIPKSKTTDSVHTNKPETNCCASLWGPNLGFEGPGSSKD